MPLSDNERNARVQARYDELRAEGKHGHYETMFHVVREEVDRLSTSPLPSDIAGLIYRLNNPLWVGTKIGAPRLAEDTVPRDMKEAAAALEQLARENERKRTNLRNCAAKMREDLERIRALEVERGVDRPQVCEMIELDDVIGKLTSAALQLSPKDDQIIAGHIRDSVALLLKYRHQTRERRDVEVARAILAKTSEAP